MELGGVPIKKKWIFPLRLIFYVCSSERNWVSSMYKGIDQFPLGSSDPGCLKFLNWNIKETPGHPKWSISFCFVKKMSFSSSPHDRCRRTMKKNYFAMKTNGIGWCSSKRWWIFPLRLIFYVCSSARNWVSSMYKGIDQFPLGSSDPGCLKFLNWNIKKNTRSPEMIFFLLC